MPMSANVRSMPEAMPNASGGAAFITGELLAGKKKLVPTPLMMLASTTTHRPRPRQIMPGRSRRRRVRPVRSRSTRRPADPLQDAEADDRGLVPGQAAGQRAEHEDREAHLVHPDPAEHVAEPADLSGEQRDDEQEGPALWPTR